MKFCSEGHRFEVGARKVRRRKRIGARISTIDDGSMKLPAASRSTLAMSRKPIRPTPVPSMPSAIACGMFSCVIRNENSIALVMM